MEHRPTPTDRTGIHPDDCDCGGIACEQDRLDKLAGDPVATCCAECAFEDDWDRAPATVKRLVERNDAEYFWLRGAQAGRISEQVETRKWLQMMKEAYDERVRR